MGQPAPVQAWLARGFPFGLGCPTLVAFCATGWGFVFESAQTMRRRAPSLVQSSGSSTNHPSPVLATAGALFVPCGADTPFDFAQGKLVRENLKAQPNPGFIVATFQMRHPEPSRFSGERGHL